jgi:uncharacterized protein (TIGR02118 family)
VVKVTVLYGKPDDPTAFEDHYASTHLALVAKMPGMRRFEHGHVVGTHDGGPPPYYRIAELWFDSEEELLAAMATPEGEATAADVPKFASGGATIMISTVDTL